jgi:hypothetical protein
MQDSAFEACRRAGLTSLQSYLYWAEIEREPGKVDFSTYDVLVQKLHKHGLKWVPFLILGPNYATPDWFQNSQESVYARCLEHGRESRIQSIWNPALPHYVDRFLRLVAGHYRNSGVIESITLGISGNWGEALYPIDGGFRGGFHTHHGWWCGDEYAIADFRQFAIGKYGSIEAINAAWGTAFDNFASIGYPPVNPQRLLDLARQVYRLTPNRVKPLLVSLKQASAGMLSRGMSISNRLKLSPERGGSPKYRQRWLDFVEWYLDSMTGWADFWLRTARRHFPVTEIYLVTGGEGWPILGADFSAQVKTAARYSAGIRVTNQNDDYNKSFILTRHVASASRFYSTYFTTEEATVNHPRAVPMRVFDALASGAKGFYCKSIIGTGTDTCTGHTYSIGEPTQGAVELVRNLHHLASSQPIIDIAVLLPSSSIALRPRVLDLVYGQCSRLRDLLDLDLVDETLIADGALEHYRFLVIVNGDLLKRQTLTGISGWVHGGGVLITAKNRLISDTDGDTGPYSWLFSRSEGVMAIGAGYTLVLGEKGRRYLEAVARAVHNLGSGYPWAGVPQIDGEWDGVYASRFPDRIVYFNSTNTAVVKKVYLKGADRETEFKIEANSILSLSLEE